MGDGNKSCSVAVVLVFWMGGVDTEEEAGEVRWLVVLVEEPPQSFALSFHWGTMYGC
jgi:hypothetical protein